MPKVSLADAEAVFSALAHEARRNIILILSHFGDELPSGYLAARFQHSWPTTTRHLGVLEKAGLVAVRRQGRGSLYRLNRERLRQVVEGWLGYLEPVDPRKTWISLGPKTTEAFRFPSPSQPGVPRWPPRPPEAIPRKSS
ncbi:MAG TPA: metalloregulator ArsR/SmtB family transcription factor, partial [Myxococcaceae bacterium]|nr:metalloregulator ArsR/SmtB family transcription factor [Myxococcaceae bacterium]